MFHKKINRYRKVYVCIAWSKKLFPISRRRKNSIKGVQDGFVGRVNCKQILCMGSENIILNPSGFLKHYDSRTCY